MVEYNRFTRRAPGTGVTQPTRRVPGGVATFSGRPSSGGAPFAVNNRGGPPTSGGGQRTFGTGGPIDISGALAEVRSAINEDFDAEAKRLAAQYSSQLAGIGGHGGAIAEAQRVLSDVRANRAALKGVYDEYEKIIDPLAQQAIDEAAAVLGEVTPELEQLARQAAESIAADYAEAETIIAEEATKINAGGAAARAVQAEVTELEAQYQADAAAASEEHLVLLGLETDMARTAAIAADEMDEGQMQRRYTLQDAAFAEMEEQAQAALAAARRAAAAAAARRRAVQAERDAALAELEQEKYAALKLNPHEAGEVTAINYLRQAGSDLDYNRQQLVFNTLSEAISQQVPANQVGAFISNTIGDGVLTKKEQGLVTGGLYQYTQGMRHQQDLDKRRSTGTGGYDWRSFR